MIFRRSNPLIKAIPSLEELFDSTISGFFAACFACHTFGSIPETDLFQVKVEVTVESERTTIGTSGRSVLETEDALTDKAQSSRLPFIAPDDRRSRNKLMY
jgi:hypothetical protein